MKIEQYKTACPRNCYSTCSFIVNVRDGKIGLIEPDKSNKATGEGICSKGLSYFERVYHPDRILHPLKKIDGKYERISWNEALGLISSNIQKVQKEYGSKSILYYSASGTKGLLNSVGADFWELIGGYTTTYGDLCWQAGLEATRLTYGDIIDNHPWEIVNSKLIVVWGKNPAETNVHQIKFLNQAKENGAKIVVIDSRRTETSELADLFIQPKPGTDGLLALTIAKLLFENGKVDNNFLEKYVLGYKEFEASLGNIEIDKTSEFIGVPVDQIYQLVDLIGNIKPMSIIAGYGMQRYSNGGQTIRSIISLLLLTGNIGKPGSGWNYANLNSHIFSKVKDPIASFKPEKEGKKVRTSVSVTKLGKDILSQTDPPIKMIWVERGNPVTQNPDTNKVLEAFRSVDFRVVVEQFMTDTALEADLVLPAKTMFEQSDIINAYWHSYIQYKRKIIEPVGEVKPESEIYYLLAKQMGYTERDFERKIPNPDDDSIEEFLEQKLTESSDIKFEDLQKEPILIEPKNKIAYEDFKFNTPSGKIELLSNEAEERWGVDKLPSFSYPEELANNDSLPYYFMTPNTKNRIHTQFGNLSIINQFDEKPVLNISSSDATRENLTNGDTVKVFNNRGELTLPLNIDDGLKPGCLSMTNGWWIQQGGTPNLLSNSVETDMGYGTAFHDNKVAIKKL